MYPQESHIICFEGSNDPQKVSAVTFVWLNLIMNYCRLQTKKTLRSQSFEHEEMYSALACQMHMSNGFLNSMYLLCRGSLMT